MDFPLNPKSGFPYNLISVFLLKCAADLCWKGSAGVFCAIFQAPPFSALYMARRLLTDNRHGLKAQGSMVTIFTFGSQKYSQECKLPVVWDTLIFKHTNPIPNRLIILALDQWPNNTLSQNFIIFCQKLATIAKVGKVALRTRYFPESTFKADFHRTIYTQLRVATMFLIFNISYFLNSGWRWYLSLQESIGGSSKPIDPDACFLRSNSFWRG